MSADRPPRVGRFGWDPRAAIRSWLSRERPVAPAEGQPVEVAAKPATPGRWFTWQEWERSATAERHGLDNSVAPEHYANVVATCEVLDAVRDHIRGPLRITSGYRAAEVNRAMPGASPTSDHRYGLAADIDSETHTAWQLATIVHEVCAELDRPYDQIIWYADKGHVHVGFGGRFRSEFLMSNASDGPRVYRRSEPIPPSVQP